MDFHISSQFSQFPLLHQLMKLDWHEFVKMICNFFHTWKSHWNAKAIMGLPIPSLQVLISAKLEKQN